ALDDAGQHQEQRQPGAVQMVLVDRIERARLEHVGDAVNRLDGTVGIGNAVIEIVRTELETLGIQCGMDVGAVEMALVTAGHMQHEDLLIAGRAWRADVFSPGGGAWLLRRRRDGFLARTLPLTRCRARFAACFRPCCRARLRRYLAQVWTWR